MRYLLTIYADEAQWTGMTSAEQQQAVAAYNAYTEALKSAGVLVGANRLAPARSARLVRVDKGETHVVDGPFAETKEQLGGYYLIDVRDEDEALTWAARCPGASNGAVEVRPLWGETA